jgi:MoxR-like ATPase
MSSFTGTASYILDEELAKIVNVAIRLELPLLLKGEPGTGKPCWRTRWPRPGLP